MSENFELPVTIVEKWQKLITSLSKSFNVPTIIINKLEDDGIKIFQKYSSTNNSSEIDNINELNTIFCSKVVQKKSKLTIYNTTADSDWKDQINLRLGKIAYLGYPLLLPNETIFGTICILDKKENYFSKKLEELLISIKQIIELDLASYYSYEQKSILLEQKLYEQLKTNSSNSSASKYKSEKNKLNQKKNKPTNNLNIGIKYNKLIDKMHSALVILSPIWSNNGKLVDAIYVDMNPMNERLIGHKKDEIIGMSVLDVFPKTKQEWFEQFIPVQNTNKNINYTIYHDELDKHFLVNSFQIENGLFCILYSDISNFIDLERKFEERENFYSSIFNNVKTAIVVFDPVTNKYGELIDLRYADMNTQNESFINLKKENILGKTVMEVFPETNKKFIDHFQISFKTKQVNTFEEYHSPLNAYFEGIVMPIKDKLIFACNDINHRVKVNNELKQNEERFRAIYENSSSAMFLVDAYNGKIIDANHTTIKETGYSKEKFLQLNISDISLSGKGISKTKLTIGGKSKNNYFETKYKKADGAIRDIQVYTSLITYQNKKVFHVLIHDITDKNNDHLEVIKLSQALEQAPVSVIITNPKGNIEYSNPKNCKITGYQPIELIGKNPNIFRSGKMSKHIYEKMWKTIKKGNKWEGEFYNTKKDGNHYWEQATIAPIINEKGIITSFIKIGKDITKQKILQEELYKAKIKAEESDRLKTSFLANLSHEVRTPLNSILGFNDLLLSKHTNEESKFRYIEIIQESGQQLLMIINDLVKLSQIESKQLSIKLSYFSIADLLNEIKDTYTLEIENKGIKFEIYFSSCLNYNIKADKKRIRQVLDNLIKNAIKFTDKGVISINAECTPDSLHFKVKDTGIGIAKDNYEIIFERFRQVEEHYTRNYGGNGLGLSISKEIVELMGGDIWLNSIQSKGTTFHFTIPHISRKTIKRCT